MADTPTPRSLRREVLLPDRASPGWGALAVAASAMTFALAGSLLMIRATSMRHGATMGREHVCPAAAETAIVHQQPAAPPPASACRGPVYQSHNGAVEAVFELCPDGLTAP
ncbi:MAG: hypothetical protein K8W52_02830 [Deltaproteobacteria bacterium]|nr:hypothetical protein [Deltaproteobacteria bacterium]